MIFLSSMEEVLVKSREFIQKGSIVVIVVSILISILLYFMNKMTFVCLDPDICSKMNEPLIKLP